METWQARGVALRTKRWNDPPEAEDGFRLLICRYRPRGVPKENEPWDLWCAALGPSKKLHAMVYGKLGEPPIDFGTYERLFRAEMKSRGSWLEAVADRVRREESVTLLCSSACTDPLRCHRSIVQSLVEALVSPAPPAPVAAVVRRRPRS